MSSPCALSLGPFLGPFPWDLPLWILPFGSVLQGLFLGSFPSVLSFGPVLGSSPWGSFLGVLFFGSFPGIFSGPRVGFFPLAFFLLGFYPGSSAPRIFSLALSFRRGFALIGSSPWVLISGVRLLGSFPSIFLVFPCHSLVNHFLLPFLLLYFFAQILIPFHPQTKRIRLLE